MARKSHEGKTKQGSRRELLKEVAALGQQVEKAIRAAATSEHSAQIKRHVQNVVRAGKEQGVEAGQKLKLHLAAGLREIGGELARLAEKLDGR